MDLGLTSALRKLLTYFLTHPVITYFYLCSFVIKVHLHFCALQSYSLQYIYRLYHLPV